MEINTNQLVQVSMAIASGQAGGVLARPLRWVNVHLRTLNTAHEVVRSRPNCLNNGCPSSCKFQWQKGNVTCVRSFSHFGLLDAHTAYCDKDRAPCGTCVQLSSYAESEIATLIFQPRPVYNMCSASDGKVGGDLYSMWIRILLACLWLQLRSDLRANCMCLCVFSAPQVETKLWLENRW